MILNHNPEINIFNHDNIDRCCHLSRPAEGWQLWSDFFDMKPITDMYKEITATSAVEVQHCARHTLNNSAAAGPWGESDSPWVP